MKRLWCFLLASLCTLFCLVGCERQAQEEKDIKFNVGNNNTAVGRLAHRDGFIYFADSACLYEYDTASGKTAILDQTGLLKGFYALFVTEDRVWFTHDEGLHYVTRDGKQCGTCFTESGELGTQFCADGKDAYFLRSTADENKKWKTSLFHMDWETGVTKLLSGDHDVYSYSLDDNNIYIVEQIEQYKDYEVLISDRKNVAFQKIDLSFEPIMTYPTDEGLYISSLIGDGVTFLYRDGAVTELPVSSGPYYHVVGKNLIYQDFRTTSQTNSKGCHALVLYNMETGEKRVLNDSVWEFGVLEDRYICYWWADDAHQKWYCYDLQTGQTKLMYEIKDSMTQYGYGVS